MPFLIKMVQHFMYVKIVISNMLGKKNKSVGCACCLIVLAVLGVIIYGIVQLLIL